MRYVLLLWGGILAGVAIVALPIVVPALLWGDWGAIAGGIFWFVVAVSLLTVAFAEAMKEER